MALTLRGDPQALDVLAALAADRSVARYIRREARRALATYRGRPRSDNGP